MANCPNCGSPFVASPEVEAAAQCARAEKAETERNEWEARAVRAEEERDTRWRIVLRDHALVRIECDHEAQRDKPYCLCSLVDLGWHQNVGFALEAWVDHVTESVRRVDEVVAQINQPEAPRVGSARSDASTTDR